MSKGIAANLFIRAPFVRKEIKKTTLNPTPTLARVKNPKKQKNL
jgi:hypothetical protein